MKNSHKLSIAQIDDLLKVGLEFQIRDKSEGRKWLEKLLRFHNYFKLSKKEKGTIIDYASIVLCLSQDRVKKLCSIWHNTGRIERQKYKRTHSHNKYTREDIALVYETRDLHQTNGNAIKKILVDEYIIYRDTSYINIKDISVSYIYVLLGKNSHNLRGTASINAAIGIRQALSKDGLPGHISIDSVHQKENNEDKELYYINVVDYHTQWQRIYIVTAISQRYLAPVLKDILKYFPFKITEFHSDNGSEFINKVISNILNRMHVKQLKSRSFRSEDNGQVETKNTIIRKEMGYTPIDSKYIPQLDTFFKDYYDEYLNYHHPCGFPEIKIDDKGRIRKKYKQSDYMTPYQRLKFIDPKGKSLKKEFSFKEMDNIELRYSHNQYMKLVQIQKHEILKDIYSLKKVFDKLEN